jgi:hypothetical protein
VPDGSVQVFDRPLRLNHHDRLWLATDASGNIVLVASSDKLLRHTVQGLRVEDAMRKSVWSYRNTGSVAALIVDLSGVRLVMSTGEVVRVKGVD